MEPEVSEMIVPSQRDDSAVPELRPAKSDGPQQPVLREYNPQNFGNEAFTRENLEGPEFEAKAYLAFAPLDGQ